MSTQEALCFICVTSQDIMSFQGFIFKGISHFDDQCKSCFISLLDIFGKLMKQYKRDMFIKMY